MDQAEKASGQDSAEPLPRAGRAVRSTPALTWLVVFAAAIFASAFLLFQVQPLIAKFILPWFGGGPGVWTTCLLFFQVLLLAGYGYAHLSASRFAPRTQAGAHLALLLVALFCLPITPDASWKPADSSQPMWGILSVLSACVGVPYFALASTGPLLQAWFSRAQPGVLPYRLYAVSNAGSLLALLSYPFVVEPNLSRRAQAELWSYGLLAFVFVCAICAVRLWRGAGHSPEIPSAETRSSEERISTGTKWLWLAWPACASLLLLATTNKICQDISVIPFLWVLPLTLYLASFILCFDHPRWYRRNWFGGVLGPALGLGWFVLWKSTALHLPVTVQVAGYLAALFLCCMICHGEVYRLKPSSKHLTSFYLFLAAGGALGAAFVSVAAPLIFRSYLELPLGWWLCVVLMTAISWRGRQRMMRVRFWAGPAVWPVLGAAALGVAFAAHVRQVSLNALILTRNFYGVLRVMDFDDFGPALRSRLLICGEITHGFQFLDPELAGIPTSYYHEGSGIGRAFQKLPGESRRIGVVGLGIGTLAAYGRVSDTIRFYEINPAVKHLAETRFTYLAHSAGQLQFVLGDARLSLERETAQNFDLLVLDAFNGDAIPVHLLTREAFTVYLRHLKSEGVLAVHLTNRHLDLRPVLEQLALDAGLRWSFIDVPKNPREGAFFDTQWALLGRDATLLPAAETAFPLESPVARGRRVRLWTDDYASLLPILKEARRGGAR